MRAERPHPLPPPRRADLGGVPVGDGLPVAVMGVLNVSPESFHPGSIHTDPDALVAAALGMVEAGAALLDVGARSTAPGRPPLDPAEECARLGRAVERLAARVPVPISADTTSAAAARVALEAGARVVNDQSGLADPALGALVAAHGAGLVAMASGAGERVSGPPLAAVRLRLARCLARARAAGVPDARVVLDPGLGFFRDAEVPWHAWDTAVLAGLDALADLGRPLCVGLSRKSFLGELTGRRDPADRLPASLAATVLAVLRGAAVVRTHDVGPTVDALRVTAAVTGSRP